MLNHPHASAMSAQFLYAVYHLKRATRQPTPHHRIWLSYLIAANAGSKLWIDCSHTDMDLANNSEKPKAA